jgi:transcriptional regulator GlxA family with amidase domain
LIERARFDEARSRLESSDENIDQIAGQCGYGSDEVLRRTFVRRAGVTPKDYRKRFRRSQPEPIL